MLILPLHRPINRHSFPLVTAGLVLVNLLVFFLFQLRDGEHAAQASRYYIGSGLAALEAEPYARYRQQQPDPALDQLLAEAGEASPDLQVALQEADEDFRDFLLGADAFDGDEARAAWSALHAPYAQQRARLITERFDLEADAPGPVTLLSSQFLHGGVDHLLGNMLFLIALGLLVEGALGGVAFLALYLLGGVAAGMAWSLSNTGGALIGASGAIAALMGAFCVIWGLRKVRFFYWLFVVFDYVRGPALLLLPAWLGWELLQWALRDGSRVAYEAHAGGLLAGAALGLLANRLGLSRAEFLEDVPAEQSDSLPEALRLLGRLELDAAAVALEACDRQQPGRIDVALARARCALLQRQPALASGHLQRMISGRPPAASELQEFAALVEKLTEQGVSLPPAAEVAWLRILLARGDKDAAGSIVRAWPQRERAPLAPQPLLGIAVALRDAGLDAESAALLGALQRWAPQSEQAGKAAFLLSQ
jgi:membrane associated rhomboid family serine protease